MRIRHAGAVLASSAIAISAAALTVAAPAYAATDQFYVTTPSGAHYYLVLSGRDAIVEGSSGNFFLTDQDDQKWGSRPVYEWAENGLCLASNGVDEQVSMQPCATGASNPNQLWWSSNGYLLNYGASSGTSECLNASHAEDGAAVNVIACKDSSQPGYFDQLWTGEAG
jgi:hypothetical protein